ncbi:zinc finger MYM-type protein 5-like [Hydra vulgaris]|uniref:Zinc finger MYM-type protein 5-like n=1 Tax=Hydra vulgaris TaxID=6087 RepID=A0ABM4CM92_HYDVU
MVLKYMTWDEMHEVVANEGSVFTEITITDVEFKDKDEKQLSESDIYTTDELLGNDPGLWPEYLNDCSCLSFVKQGYVRIENISFSRDEKDSQKFSAFYYTKVLPNSKKDVARRWLVYSKSKNTVFCFCCELFSTSNNRFSDAGGGV